MQERKRLEYGGSLRKGRRKTARPIATRTPIHLVLRSSRARGAWNMLRPRHARAVNFLVVTLAERYDVRVYSFANVGNHLHIIASVKRREALRNFMRVLTQMIMFRVTGACKGSPQGRFWDSSYYSRVASWGAEYKRLRRYLQKNHLEAFGFSRQWVDDIFNHPVNRALAAP